MQSIKSFFHFCSGIHPDILKRTPSDSQKYAGIGATIFFTGIFAAIAGGFAIHSVFNSYVIAIIFGLLWGLMIFNLDRYIVMSMKKKDRWYKEIATASPRIFLAVLIAFVISKPLELQLFRSEIAAELTLMEQEVIKAQEEVLMTRFSDKTESLKLEIAELENKIEAKRTKRDGLNLAAIQEADGTGGSKQRNLGPIYKAKKRTADAAQLELEDAMVNITPMIIQKREALAQVESQVEQEDAAMEKARLSGFAAQLDALGRIADKSSTIWWASLFITLLFISIETAPVFTKLISDRSPYDYRLDEHEKHFWSRHAITTARLQHFAESDVVFDGEILRHRTQLTMEAEKELLGDLLGQEVDRLKREPMTWAEYLRRRSFFGIKG